MRAAAALAAVLLAAPAAAQDAPPAGLYHLDPAHARLTVKADHLGFSTYPLYFRRFAATLQFDPGAPAAMRIEAAVDLTSVETFFPDPATLDFNAALQAPEWLDAAAHPVARFVSTAVEPTGPDTARVTGRLSLRGVTREVVLRARYNGGYGGHPMDPAGARIGFSVTAELDRSAFGMTFGIPAPGTTLGVADRVGIEIEAEFGNALPPAEF
jgi:polyisoprenoid-binding protein YceI